MRVTINLATRPFANIAPALKRLRVGMGILALLAIALGFALHAVHQKAEQARARERILDAQIARIAQERQGYQILMQRPDNAELLKQAAALNSLFDEKAFSWTLAMENLETVLPGGVQVVTLEPVRDKDGHITLHLRVDGPRDRAVELVRNLEHSRRFFEPRIVGESSAETGTGANQRLEPVSATNRFNFDLLAEYNPPSADEAKATRNSTKKDSTADEDSMPSSEAPQAHPAFTQHRVRPPYTGTVRRPDPTAGGAR